MGSPVLLVAAVDQLRPLRPPLDLDVAPSFPVGWLVAVLVLVVVGALVLLRRSLSARLPSGPAAVAERELLRLLNLGLAEQGRLKEHYGLLTACLRRYVSAVYGLPATALTPTELVTLAPLTMDPRLVDYLRRVLGSGDLVRFDHTSKTVAEARADVLGALDVVRADSSPATASAA